MMDTWEYEQTKDLVVVPSAAVPMLSSAAEGDLDVRRLIAHDLLRQSIPGGDVNLAWIVVKEGQIETQQAHHRRCLLLVLHGAAMLVGAMRGSIEQGDVITVPAGAHYGFEGVGPQGLRVLRVDFDEPQESSGDDVDLATLLSRNQARCEQLLRGPFFTLLRDRVLESEEGRAKTLECVRVFADAFQTFLFTRQAMCLDPTYSTEFNQHLREEIGHNELLQVSLDTPASRDPVLRASSAWFCHQMLVLDNLGKTVVNLVLETAGYHLGTTAGPRFEGHHGANYFDTHGEADEEHQNMGLDKLSDQHPDTYRRLYRVLEDTWTMLETMTQRLAHLIRLQVTSS